MDRHRSRRRKTVFGAQADEEQQRETPLTETQPGSKRAAGAELSRPKKVLKETVVVDGLVLKRVVQPASASAPAPEKHEAPPAAAAAGPQESPSAAPAADEGPSVPPYPASLDALAAQHEVVPEALEPAERVKRLCQLIADAERDKLDAAFGPPRAAFVRERGAGALEEFTLAVEEACVRGELRGLPAQPGLADRKRRLHGILEWYKKLESEWTQAEKEQMEKEKHRAELAQHDAKAAEAAAAAAAAANASTMGEAAAAVAAADQKLRLQVETAQGNAATMRSMVERAEALCQRLTEELSRVDEGALPHVHSPHKNIASLAAQPK